jgi:hypothetical protein
VTIGTGEDLIFDDVLDSLGLDTVIGDKSVFDPGTVDTAANIERAKLLKKNKPYDSNDPSENN